MLWKIKERTTVTTPVDPAKAELPKGSAGKPAVAATPSAPADERAAGMGLDPAHAPELIDALVAKVQRLEARLRSTRQKLHRTERQLATATSKRQYDGTLREGHNRRNRRVQRELTTLRDRLESAANLHRQRPGEFRHIAVDEALTLANVRVELGKEIAAIDELIVSLRQPLESELKGTSGLADRDAAWAKGRKQ